MQAITLLGRCFSSVMLATLLLVACGSVKGGPLVSAVDGDVLYLTADGSQLRHYNFENRTDKVLVEFGEDLLPDYTSESSLGRVDSNTIYFTARYKGEKQVVEYDIESSAVKNAFPGDSARYIPHLDSYVFFRFPTGDVAEGVLTMRSRIEGSEEVLVSDTLSQVRMRPPVIVENSSVVLLDQAADELLLVNAGSGENGKVATGIHCEPRIWIASRNELVCPRIGQDGAFLIDLRDGSSQLIELPRFFVPFGFLEEGGRLVGSYMHLDEDGTADVISLALLSIESGEVEILKTPFMAAPYGAIFLSSDDKAKGGRRLLLDAVNDHGDCEAGVIDDYMYGSYQGAAEYYVGASCIK